LHAAVAGYRPRLAAENVACLPACPTACRASPGWPDHV